MKSVDQATRLVLRHAAVFPAERVPVVSAAGRVLREFIKADRDFPPYDRSKMDGIAIAAGGREFRVERTLAAGRPGGALKHRRSGCVRIMTGAVIPRGCDSVVPSEHYIVRGGWVLLNEDVRVEKGQFIHRRGADRKKGDTLLKPGAVLGGPGMAVAVTAGKTHVHVTRRPRIVVVSTGDELVAIGERARPFEVRPSNAHGIRTALVGWGFPEVTLAHVRDDREKVLRVLKRALAKADVLITTGGVSEGDVDYVPSVLRELGVRKIFHRVSQRPGKPLWFGIGPRGQRVFGLPGNPVSTLTCLRRYVLPALVVAAGVRLTGPEKVLLGRKVTGLKRLTYFAPVRVRQDGKGRIVAEPVRYGGSGDLAALSDSDGFVELPPTPRPYRAGALVNYFGW
ncbi:MAG TPA: molybdopterin molybdotransferase MoeA [Kiritimatiellia bacterium]